MVIVDYCLTPTDIYVFKVNNENSRIICEICSKLIIMSNALNLFKDDNMVAVLLTLITLFCIWKELQTTKYKIQI